MRIFFKAADRQRKGDAEVESLEQGRALAVRHVANLLLDQPSVNWAGDEVRVEATDETGQLLFTVIVFSVDGPDAER